MKAKEMPTKPYNGEPFPDKGRFSDELWVFLEAVERYAQYESTQIPFPLPSLSVDSPEAWTELCRLCKPSIPLYIINQALTNGAFIWAIGKKFAGTELANRTRRLGRPKLIECALEVFLAATPMTRTKNGSVERFVRLYLYTVGASKGNERDLLAPRMLSERGRDLLVLAKLGGIPE